MVIDIDVLNNPTAQASLRLRMNLDLRISPADQSQRMLNAIEPGPCYPSIGIAHQAKQSSAFVDILRNTSMTSKGICPNHSIWFPVAKSSTYLSANGTA